MAAEQPWVSPMPIVRGFIVGRHPHVQPNFSVNLRVTSPNRLSSSS
jgi:hypothetical protein